MKIVDYRFVALEEPNVPQRVCSVDGTVGRQKVDQDVDACLCEGAHALVVALVGVDLVHADGVDVELLEKLDVGETELGVCKRVDVSFGNFGEPQVLVAGHLALVRYALEEKLGIVLVEELVACDVDRSDFWRSFWSFGGAASKEG